ncbi:hypothetical protein Tco_1172194 [Tanacetum coccineum]
MRSSCSARSACCLPSKSLIRSLAARMGASFKSGSSVLTLLNPSCLVNKQRVQVRTELRMTELSSLNVCDEGGLPINEEKHYWESINDGKLEQLEWDEPILTNWVKIRYGKVCEMTMERILKDHWREKFREEEDDIKENTEDPEECGEDKANIIMGTIHDKLNDDWFNGTSEDEDNLEGILDYLKPGSYDGFIDLDNEAYNKR